MKNLPYYGQDNLKEVTKDEFFKCINCLDAVVNVWGKYPYITIFEMRLTRLEIGRIKRDGTYWLKRERI